MMQPAPGNEPENKVSPEQNSPSESNPPQFILERISLPELEAHEGLWQEPDTKPVVCYHWVHIKERVLQVIEDLEKRINAKSPSKVVIHYEAVGGDESGRESDMQQYNTLINSSRWFNRPYLAVSNWLTGVMNRNGDFQGECLKMQSSFMNELGKLADRTGAEIEIRYIDITGNDPEYSTLGDMYLGEMQHDVFLSLNLELASAIAEASTGTSNLQDLLSESVRNAMIATRYSLSARDAVVCGQLEESLNNAERDELHAVLTGAGHKSVARILPPSLRHRVVIALSPEVLSLLPVEMHTTALASPHSYSIERILTHPFAPEARDIQISLFGDALQQALFHFLSKESDVYSSLSRKDKVDLSALLATYMTIQMADDDLEHYTNCLFENVEKMDGELAAFRALTMSAEQIFQTGFNDGSFPVGSLVRKVLNRLEIRPSGDTPD